MAAWRLCPSFGQKSLDDFWPCGRRPVRLSRWALVWLIEYRPIVEAPASGTLVMNVRPLWPAAGRGKFFENSSGRPACKANKALPPPDWPARGLVMPNQLDSTATRGRLACAPGDHISQGLRARRAAQLVPLLSFKIGRWRWRRPRGPKVGASKPFKPAGGQDFQLRAPLGPHTRRAPPATTKGAEREIDAGRRANINWRRRPCVGLKSCSSSSSSSSSAWWLEQTGEFDKWAAASGGSPSLCNDETICTIRRAGRDGAAGLKLSAMRARPARVLGATFQRAHSPTLGRPRTASRRPNEL